MTKIAHFLDFELNTENSVFFPRPETEILVEKALLYISGKRSCNILDIGTGSGNIAIGLTKYLTSSKIVALDISDTALRVARENAENYGVEKRIEFVKSDVFKNLPKRYKNFFDLIISNPPYVALEDFFSLPPEVRNDPYGALYGGRDGLDFYRAISKKAPIFLKKGAVLIMEIGYNQARGVKKILDDSGMYEKVEFHKDYVGINRIIKAEAI